MKVTSQITVDLLHPNVATLVYAKQTDQHSRFISATLLEGSQPWTPPTGVLAAVRYRKPDGTIGWYDTTENKAAAVTMSGNVATIQLAAQALTVSGDVYIELEFYTQSAEKLSSFAWVLAVEASAVSDGEIESSDYFNVLADTLAEIVKALPDIQNADEYAKAAAASAAQAASSEATAKASEQAAAGSVEAADNYAQTAAGAAASATQAATAAQSSATEAEASEKGAATLMQTAQNAATSAGYAAESADAARQDSEAWAVGTRDGQAVPTSDETYNNNSKYWAQQAAAAAGGGVITFNGRGGAVMPMEGDYTPAMVGSAPAIKTAIVTLPVASWTGSASPYSQTVEISNVTANSRIDINPDTAVMNGAMEGGYGLVFGNNAGVITAYAVGDKPTAEITVQVSITEVTA